MKKFVVALLFVGLLVSCALAQEVTVAAAADLNYALKDLAARFEQKTGDKATLSFGSSGNLFSQIQSGAPFDLFFSADEQYLQTLIMDLLLQPSVKRIAIANPQHAPYGRAAMAAIEHYGMKDKLTSKLVFGENISQAAQFVQS